MFLKRFLIVALGALGLGALAAGPASADIPPPKLLIDVAACIEAHAGARPASVKALAPDGTDTPGGGTPGGGATGVMITPAKPTSVSDPSVNEATIADLFKADKACAYTTAVVGNSGGPYVGIDLQKAIASAAMKLKALDPEDDDYQAERAKVFADFSGPIIDALAVEVDAQRDAEAAKKKFDDAVKSFTAEKREFKKDADGKVMKVDGVEQREDSGAEKARYWSLTHDADVDPDPADIAYRELGGVKYDWKGGEEDSNVIVGITVDGSQFVTDKERKIDDSTTIQAVTDWKEAAETDRNRAQAVLAADGTDTGITLTEREKSHLNDVVKFRTDEMAKYDAAIASIEGSGDANKLKTAEYRAAVSKLESLWGTTKARIADQVTRNKATEAALIEPVDHMDTLIALAGDDKDRSARTKLIKQTYLDATAEPENPVSGLVDGLLYGDDDGKALVDAISGTYDLTVDNKDDIAGLIADGGAVDTNTLAIADNRTDIDANTGRIEVNEGNIAANTGRIEVNEGNIAANTGRIEVNEGDIATNKADIATNAGDIVTNAGNIMANSGRIDTNAGNIATNMSAIGANTSAIGANKSAIGTNTTRIGELSESLDVVRAGVAASMALAGMPSINGRGIALGVGSFDGESAFAIGFQIQSETTSFKVGLTSGGGATGASAGVGFQF